MKSILRVGLIGLVLVVGGRSELALGDWDHCNEYPNQRVVSTMGGTSCGGTGQGCRFCWDDGDGSYCYGNMPDGCGIDHQILPW
jgi:hypothetical protein